MEYLMIKMEIEEAIFADKWLIYYIFMISKFSMFELSTNLYNFLIIYINLIISSTFLNNW